ncbi:MAG: nuclear transport factor 2 family protein [Methylovulum sp.]|jgi:nuclear transport factor 2 (NTF2) superfamily protein|nr:nuclear transport factor 2 family protein [Methylovulum sp.]
MTQTLPSRPPIPPFTALTASQKVRMAEDAWNTRDAEKVALAYTLNSNWRNRSEFINGREEIIAFLQRKWTTELDYRLVKELWAFADNRIAVRFAYEWHTHEGAWYRSYGNENWEFNEQGLMQCRYASINDLPILESERKLHWPLGIRPLDYPNLSAMNL